ncbi:hypothetical protein HDU93_001100, partial [Gonapodya sp. JEL0774]
EPAVKQMILQLQDAHKHDKFVIDEDFGDRFIFVDKDYVDTIRAEIEEMMEQHTYKIADKEVE